MILVFASNNQNKIKEIQKLVPSSIQILSLDAIGCTVEIPETAATIEGNAQLKANYVTEKYGYACFADDSGLEVDALQGAPGVFSARYAGEPKNDDNNMSKLLHDLNGNPHRKANFKTVICLNYKGKQHLFTGIVDGTLIEEKRGTNGFGYDPIFIPNGYSKTFAEMTIEEKSSISHRGQAVKQLIAFCETLQD
ncbi:non-canonical purine NTP diphosphatase [Flavobacterium aciduliphilum]|uniref:dITP/XTP pyrophosphatase n=1 Tax=Flavobacterium aciduliphilum TaxID=1101402 RepID=A0A328YFG3_9FLAO|nr:non-canonical purine NTP diphosphatase [Flavobacterium aciduliphilum]RAR70762.1 XTP/dITP diphosphohydrolase [Flavobacterium aciduliphilum]